MRSGPGLWGTVCWASKAVGAGNSGMDTLGLFGAFLLKNSLDDLSVTALAAPVSHAAMCEDGRTLVGIRNKDREFM
jgi:hypothetical protein